MTAKTLATGHTHVTAGAHGCAKSRDGLFDIRLLEPHPAAEDLFAAA